MIEVHRLTQPIDTIMMIDLVMIQVMAVGWVSRDGSGREDPGAAGSNVAMGIGSR